MIANRLLLILAMVLPLTASAAAEDLWIFRKGPVYGGASQAERYCMAMDMAARTGKMLEADLAVMEAECNRMTAEEKPDFSGLVDAMNNPPPKPDRLDELEQQVEDLEERLDKLEVAH